MQAELNILLSKALLPYQYISPGSYTFVLRDGSRRQFDFLDTELYISKIENSVCFVLKNIDETYEDGNKITLEDIENIDHIEEIFLSFCDPFNEETPAPEIERIKLFGFFDREEAYLIPKNILATAKIHIE